MDEPANQGLAVQKGPQRDASTQAGRQSLNLIETEFAEPFIGVSK
jgi:hypothetical protein